jgi:hypothetical protein
MIWAVFGSWVFPYSSRRYGHKPVFSNEISATSQTSFEIRWHRSHSSSVFVDGSVNIHIEKAGSK